VERLWDVLIGLVIVAIALRVAWDLLSPLLPLLALVVIAALTVRVVAWYRDRW